MVIITITTYCKVYGIIMQILKQLTRTNPKYPKKYNGIVNIPKNTRYWEKYTLIRSKGSQILLFIRASFKKIGMRNWEAIYTWICLYCT